MWALQYFDRYERVLVVDRSMPVKIEEARSHYISLMNPLINVIKSDGSNSFNHYTKSQNAWIGKHMYMGLVASAQ